MEGQEAVWARRTYNPGCKLTNVPIGEIPRNKGICHSSILGHDVCRATEGKRVVKMGSQLVKGKLCPSWREISRKLAKPEMQALEHRLSACYSSIRLVLHVSHRFCVPPSTPMACLLTLDCCAARKSVILCRKLVARGEPSSDQLSARSPVLETTSPSTSMF